MSGTEPQRRGNDSVESDALVVTAGIVSAPGAAPHIGSITLPRRAPGFTLLEVLAAPVNPLDLLIASGNFHSARHDEPYVPGSECVGTVLESDSFATGTRLYAECHASPSMPGAFATHVLVLDADLIVLPADVDAIVAAAIGNSGVAAYLPLIERAALKAGEAVLVLGATGAVGQLAIQIAKQHGAARVVGVARNRAVLDQLLTIGADAVVDLRPDDTATGLAERIAATSGPIDVVLDGLYGLPLEAALQVCGMRARVVNIGNLAGATAQVPAGILRGKQISLSGFAGLHTPLSEKATALNWLWSASARGDITVDVNTYSLRELPAAWSAQAHSPHAKCVVLPDGSQRSGSTKIN